MRTEIIKEILVKSGMMLEKNSPTILTYLGVSGSIATVCLAIKATHNMDEYLAKNKEANDVSSLKSLLKMVVKTYTPTVISGIFTIGCIVGANSINIKRNLALVGAYNASREAFITYQNKVNETVGESQVKDIKEAWIRDRMKKADKTVIIGEGDIDCFDILSGRYFKSSMNDLTQGVANANRLLFFEDKLSLNDLYEEIGIDGINIGNELGWDIDGGLIELDINSMVSNDNKPVLTIDFDPKPSGRRY